MKLKQYFKRNFDRNYQLNIARFIFILVSFVYFISGYFYRQLKITDPLNIQIRLVISLIFLSAFLLTFFSTGIKKYAYEISTIGLFATIIHLVFHSYHDNFTLNYIFSLMIVIFISLFLSKAKHSFEEAIVENKIKYESLINNMEAGLAYHKIIRDENNEIIDYIFLEINKEFEKIFGLKRENIIAKKGSEVLLSASKDCLAIYKMMQKGVDGKVIQYFQELNKYYSVLTYRQEKDKFVMIFHDITEQKKLEDKLRLKSKEYETIYQNTGDAVFLVEVKKDKFIYNRINNTHEKLTGLTNKKLKGKDPFQLFERNLAEKIISNYQECVQKKEEIIYEERLKLPAGEKYWQTKLSPVFDGDTVVKIVGISRDITKRKKAENKIYNLTFYDSLTGVYNRHYFNKELKRYDAARQLPLSIIIGDVNGLKITNDAFGHQKGDELLINIAKILKKCCRQEDLISRWGGDEFVILLPKTTAQETKKITERINDKINNLEADPVNASMAIAYATKNKSEEDINDVFKKAEDWMYEKKLVESKNTHANIIATIKKTLYESSHENYEHCKRMKDLSLQLGKKLGLTESELLDLKLLAELHDLGKVAIPKKILEKKEELSSEERKQLNKHPEIGYQIAKVSSETSKIAEYILHHHESWDGTGFPHGLEKEEIPYLSRIISVVNEFDKMTHYHPHKDTFTKEDAIKRLRNKAGSNFDPEIVEVFIKEVLKDSIEFTP